MSDFTSEYWSLYISIVTLASITGCAALLFSMGRRRVAAPAERDTADAPATTGHVWDGDLAEYNNPLPRWWMWLFYITIVFGVVYLLLYPGLGSMKGLFGWTSAGAYASERAQADATMQPIFAKYSAMDIKEVAADPTAHAMGERLFLANCSQCHGSDAGGATGIPNLRDNDWLYGGTPEAIKETITEGRNGIMPAFGDVLGTEGVRNVAAYVRSLSGLTHDELRAYQGKTTFMQVCAACHGANGKGSTTMGAPNLTDRIWLYGSSEAMILETITKGRGTPSAVTRMPAHKDLLDAGKIHLLTAYVWGLSNTKDSATP